MTLTLTAAAAVGVTGGDGRGAGLEGADQRDRPLVLIGANVLSLDSAASRPGARAILVQNGRIVVIGDSSLVDDPRARGARVLRFAGATLAPALVDHHVHLFNVGITLLNDRDHGRLFLDLGDARSLADVAARVRARAVALPAGAWILGAGWSQAAWGTGALPTRDSLDAAAPDNPVYLARGDGHAGWVNARALAAAGIDRNTANPPGGAILRRADGSPSGILLERANERMMAHVPAPADSDIVAAWRLGAAALAERGVTRVYDAGVLPLPGVVALNTPFAHYLELLRRADSVAPLPIAVNLMVPAPSALAESLLADGNRARVISPRIRITHLKLFADGALGSRGAALTHPYADNAATRGVPRMTTAEIAALAGRALDAGLGVATHAIGDEAVRRTLDAYAEVLRARPGVAPGRLRIEHFSYAREPDFARAVKMGVVLSIQGNFNASATEHPTLGEARVGMANDARVYAWRRLVKMGARLAEGSDYFTRPDGALAGFVAAIERRHAAAEGLPPAEARRLAYRLASTWYDPSGTPVAPDLQVGAPANVVVLSANPLAAPLDDLRPATVLATIFGGRVVFARAPR